MILLISIRIPIYSDTFNSEKLRIFFSFRCPSWLTLVSISYLKCIFPVEWKYENNKIFPSYLIFVGLALIILLAVLVLTLRVESLDVEYYQGLYKRYIMNDQKLHKTACINFVFVISGGLSHTELRNKRPRDCAEVSGTQGKDAVSGVYRIYPYPIGLDVFNQDGVNVNSQRQLTTTILKIVMTTHVL